MSIREFIQDIEAKLPNVVTVKQLVDLGIFSSRFEAIRRRSEGRPPEYISLSSRRIVYPKSSVVEWLQGRVKASKPLKTAVEEEREVQHA